GLGERFAAEEPGAAADDEALGNAVVTDAGAGRHELEPGLTLVWGSEGGRFRLRVQSETGASSVPAAAPRQDVGEDDFETTFDGAVVPEATPSPRTIR